MENKYIVKRQHSVISFSKKFHSEIVTSRNVVVPLTAAAAGTVPLYLAGVYRWDKLHVSARSKYEEFGPRVREEVREG